MSTAPNEPPAEVKPQRAEKAQDTPTAATASSTPAPANGAPQTQADTTASPAAPKLSNAELKAKAKAEKQARRAQVKAAKDAAPGGGPGPTSAGQSSHSATESKGNKGKSKPEGGRPTDSGAAGKAAASKASIPALPKPESLIPECFSHLSMAKRLPITQADKDVHPTVLTLGQKMAIFGIDESIARLEATLLAFKKVRSTCAMPIVLG